VDERVREGVSVREGVREAGLLGTSPRAACSYLDIKHRVHMFRLASFEMCRC